MGVIARVRLTADPTAYQQGGVEINKCFINLQDDLSELPGAMNNKGFLKKNAE